MYVWASSCSGHNRGAVQSDHARLVLARDTTAQDASEKGAVPDSRSSSNFCTVKSYSHKQTKGCHGSRHNRGASSKRATCRGYYSCCALLLPYCSLLHYKSGFLSTWVGLLSNGVGLLSNGVGLFSEERVSKIYPPPSLSSHLSSSPMGVFSRGYNSMLQISLAFSSNLHSKF